jgi:UDP-glucose:(heptosyl)LPS alpha-1,3-glucosyltransferase
VKDIKIALVRSRYTPYGGAERFVESSLSALAEKGVTLTLITREWKGPSERPVILCNPFHIGRLWRDWGFARSVRRAIAENQFSLVQSHERITGCDVFRAGDGVHAAWLEARNRTKSPLARFATWLSPWHRYMLRAEAQMFADPRLRAVICNSRMVAKNIRDIFRVPEEKLHVIYNGVELDNFSPALRDRHRARTRDSFSIPETAVVYLFVGSGFERKGAQQLLAAFAEIPDQQAYLVIVGKDRKQGIYQAQAKALGVIDRVRFCGPQQDVRPFYGAADVFVLPALYEPFSNAVLEALASGLPVITSKGSGVSELISPGINGFVCDALDTDTLASQMSALADPKLRDSASRAARASVKHLTLSDMSNRYLQLYERLLSDRP